MILRILSSIQGFDTSVKEAIAKFSAEELILDRDVAVAACLTSLKALTKGFPVLIESVQIKDIDFPESYVKAIESKQVELTLRDAEQHKLDRHKKKSSTTC